MKNGTPEDDADLLHSCIARDEAAWARFTAKYSGLIAIAAQRRIRKYSLPVSRDDLLDIRQNVLASIWKDNMLADVRNASSLTYWLAIVSGNAAMLYMRRKRRIEGAKTVSISDMHDGTEILEFIPAPGKDAAEELDRTETAGIVEKALTSLPVKERLIMQLNIIHGKKYEEISEILSMPIGTVKSYVKRAKERLRNTLKDIF
jgi:RNA polymerase sigma-70 factor, ECF subfamily